MAAPLAQCLTAEVVATFGQIVTASAKGFFERLGFAAVDRTRVPDVITAAQKRASHCLASAASLLRRNTS
jgi:N-acetylglutamate synthase-like GNAT family acetyltransferase